MEKLIIGLVGFTGFSFVYLLLVKYKLNKMNNEMKGSLERIDQLQNKLKNALDQFSSKSLSLDLPQLRYLMSMVSIENLSNLEKNLDVLNSQIDTKTSNERQLAQNAEISLNQVKEKSKIGSYKKELLDKQSHYSKLMDERRNFFLNWVESLKVKNAAKWNEFLRVEEEARLAELRRIEEAKQKKLREEEAERIRRRKKQEEDEEEDRRRRSSYASSSSFGSSDDSSSSSSSSWGGGDGGGFSGGGSSDSF